MKWSEAIAGAGFTRRLPGAAAAKGANPACRVRGKAGKAIHTAYLGLGRPRYSFMHT